MERWVDGAIEIGKGRYKRYQKLRTSDECHNYFNKVIQCRERTDCTRVWYSASKALLPLNGCKFGDGEQLTPKLVLRA
ncbi:hypothetical protein PoB_003552600 [Plakobranchus ocellatus]|uniref:Uncharacterized protein n=1 Tax=Plakobranchus ocellatus TaxID=259542 RepID=A0AAV4AL41_9GAST|nr:hypothetical protein PoB_003552600 [Plakobranchus ocellatus]